MMELTTLLSEGVPSPDDLAKATPPPERRRRGPYVMVECFQRIPCDPCAGSCRFGAIKEFSDINDLPEVDWDRCVGCGACVAACPGLAIFVIDETYSDEECLIAIPYEFIPVPARGERVALLDRRGSPVGTGTVERVMPGQKPHGTTVVWIRAPRELALTVRNFRYPVKE